jgi:hypothetical protein
VAEPLDYGFQPDDGITGGFQLAEDLGFQTQVWSPVPPTEGPLIQWRRGLGVWHRSATVPVAREREEEEVGVP